MLDDAVRRIEGILAAHNQHRVHAVVGNDAHGDGSLRGVDGHGVGGALGAKELLQGGGERRRPGVLELVNLQVTRSREVLRIYAADDLAHQGEVLRAGGDEHRVAARVDADGQRVALRGREGGNRAGPDSGTIKPLLHEGAEHRRHALGVGEFQRESLEHPAFDRRLDVDLLHETLDQFQVLLAGADDERVVQRVRLQLDLIAGQRRLAGQGLRLEPRGEDAFHGGPDAGGVVMFQRQHRKRERRVLRLRVELLQQIVDGAVVLLVGGDEQTVAPRVGENNRLVAHHVRRARGRVTLLKERRHRRGHHARVGELHRDEPDATAQRRPRLVKLPGKRLHHVEGFASACDEQRVAPLVGENGDLERVCGAFVQRGALGDARIHQPLNVRGDDVRVGILQRHDADVAQLEGELLIQLLEQALDDAEAFAVPGDDQRAGAVVHADHGLVVSPDSDGARAVVDVVQNLLDRRRVGMGKRIDANGLQAAGGGDVEFLNHILNQRKRVAARGNDEDVRQIIRLNGERRPRPSRLGGLGRAAFLQRAQPGDLRAQSLGARHGRAFGEH